ncbi:MAG: VOC family protein [Bacteroidota bacterium]|nr:VOC family protein [Bacteroidota bacterium]
MLTKTRPFLLLAIFLFTSTLILAQMSTTKTKATVNHLAVYVVDLTKSTSFYRDIIGLDTIPEPFHDGKHTWLRIGPGIALHIIQGAENKKEYYKNNHICFSVASMEGFTGILKKNGISYEDVNGKKNTVSKRVDGINQLWLQDPDGYWIEINDAKE